MKKRSLTTCSAIHVYNRMNFGRLLRIQRSLCNNSAPSPYSSVASRALFRSVSLRLLWSPVGRFSRSLGGSCGTIGAAGRRVSNQQHGVMKRVQIILTSTILRSNQTALQLGSGLIYRRVHQSLREWDLIHATLAQHRSSWMLSATQSSILH